MAISIANLTSGSSGTDTQSYASASVSPGSNTLVLVAVAIRNYSAANLGTITLSGNGLTYVEIATITFSSIASSTGRVSIFRAMGASPSAGAITITVSGTGNSACGWSVDEATGTDTTGTHGSGAIVQSNTSQSDSTQTPTVTLSALTDAVNHAVYACFANAQARNVTPGGSYNELADTNTGIGLQSEWLLPGTTTPSVTGLTFGDDSGGIAIEIKYSAGGGPTPSRAGTLGLLGIGI